MKSSYFIVAFLSILFTIDVSAQVDKINKTLYQIENGTRTLEKVKGLFPKKNKTDSSKPKAADQKAADQSTSKVTTTPGQTNPAGIKTTIVGIAGIDFPKLRAFTENIKACSGVQSAVMKYNSVSSTIEVLHSGTTEALLKLMEETSGDIFSSKNLENFEEGKITIKLK